MNARNMVAIALIVAGTLALVYGGFRYTTATHELKLGGMVLSMEDRQTMPIPVWVGVGAIALGGLLLLMGRKKI